MWRYGRWEAGDPFCTLLMVFEVLDIESEVPPKEFSSSDSVDR